jgi:UDP-N-acetylmuramoyl-tripeptide--D-alanyl-D-alanine ligase
MTLHAAAEACGGELHGCADPSRTISRAVIDSRDVQTGDLFVAYRGEKTDGHRFIKSALEKGAVCALAEYIPEDVTGPVLLVGDVQGALEKICAAYRRTLDIPVVGITGSVGKTTAKEMISSVLKQRYSVLKTEGNLNNQIGVPMTVSRIEKEHEIAVIEMGISGFGEMTGLAEIARPTIAVFTVIGRAHLEFLHDLEGVFRAKTEMLALLPEDGVVICNGDDEMLKKLRCSQHLLRFGTGENCEVRADEIELLPDGRTRCRIVYGERVIHADIPAFGRQMVYAALEGAAVGIVAGLSNEEIEAGIARYATVGRRSAVTDTGSVTLIDDSYNANPDSMRCAVDSLLRLNARHVCLLSDMLEMGPDSARLHRELGAYAREKGVDLVVAYGPLGKEIAAGAGEKGVWFEEKQTLIDALPELLKKGDAVLVKASKGMQMGEAADAVKNLVLP